MRKIASKPTILLVDDMKEDRDTWTSVLKGAGYRVVTAASESEAREKLKKYEVDLAVIDLCLHPELRLREDTSGLDLAKSLDPHLPKIILTQNPGTDSAIEALRGYGERIAYDYVYKSKPIEVLREAVRKGLRARVFLVHGRDLATLQSVESVIDKCGLRPVIIKDKSGGLTTLLAHLSRHSNVDFALVIGTLDDVGSLAEPMELRSRLRQNVIFELGYFYGSLGEDRVVVLMKNASKVEMPSDLGGLRYIEIDDAGNWRKQLRDTLHDAGFDLLALD